MHRRNFIRNAGVTAAFSTLNPHSIFAALLQVPGYKIKALRGCVSIFSERGGTIGIYQSKEGYSIIDSQFADTSKHLIDELKKSQDMPFQFLINTHHHGDHTGGNISFKGIVEHVAGHENCLTNYKRVSEQNKSVDKQLFQDTTFGKTWKQKIGKERVRAYHFGPAHTNGDAIIHLENANIAHMGDLLFNRMHPFIDRSSGASVKNWVSVMQEAKKTFDKNTLFIFGHGADPEKITGSLDDLTAFEDYLGKLIDFVAAEIKSGKSREEIIKMKEIPGLNWKANGAERSITATYDELMAK